MSLLLLPWPCMRARWAADSDLCLQHCPPGRFLLFATIGLALYVMGPAPLRRAWHRLLAMLPPMQASLHCSPFFLD